VVELTLVICSGDPVGRAMFISMCIRLHVVKEKRGAAWYTRYSTHQKSCIDNHDKLEQIPNIHTTCDIRVRCYARNYDIDVHKGHSLFDIAGHVCHRELSHVCAKQATGSTWGPGDGKLGIRMQSTVQGWRRPSSLAPKKTVQGLASYCQHFKDQIIPSEPRPQEPINGDQRG